VRRRPSTLPRGPTPQEICATNNIAPSREGP